jgi:hypothetical protein
MTPALSYVYSHPVLSTDSVCAQYKLVLLNAQATGWLNHLKRLKRVPGLECQMKIMTIGLFFWAASMKTSGEY